MRNVLVLFLLLSVTTRVRLLAQSPQPDTTSALFKNKHRWYHCVVTNKNGQVLTGYMPRYLPYAPQGTLRLLTPGGKNRTTQRLKIKELAALHYADLRYQTVYPIISGRKQEYFARQATEGKITLYVFTEQKRAPIPIPIAGAVITSSIPFDQNLFFLQIGERVVKVDRRDYIAQMSAYLADHPSLVAKIQNKTYKYRDTEALIKEYNATIADLTQK